MGAYGIPGRLDRGCPRAFKIAQKTGRRKRARAGILDVPFTRAGNTYIIWVVVECPVAAFVKCKDI